MPSKVLGLEASRMINVVWQFLVFQKLSQWFMLCFLPREIIHLKRGKLFVWCLSSDHIPASKKPTHTPILINLNPARSITSKPKPNTNVHPAQREFMHCNCYLYAYLKAVGASVEMRAHKWSTLPLQFRSTAIRSPTPPVFRSLHLWKAKADPKTEPMPEEVDHLQAVFFFFFPIHSKKTKLPRRPCSWKVKETV